VPISINHHNGFKNEFTTHHLGLVDYVFNTFDPHAFTELIAITAPKGGFATCVSGVNADDVQGFNDSFGKSISVHYEFMFCRSKFDAQPELQGKILAQMAKLIDDGKIKSTAESITSWHNIQQAHLDQESAKTLGKIVLTVDENQ